MRFGGVVLTWVLLGVTWSWLLPLRVPVSVVSVVGSLVSAALELEALVGLRGVDTRGWSEGEVREWLAVNGVVAGRLGLLCRVWVAAGLPCDDGGVGGGG